METFKWILPDKARDPNVIWGGTLMLDGGVKLTGAHLQESSCCFQRVPGVAEDQRLLRLRLPPADANSASARQETLRRLESFGLAIGLRLYRLLAVKAANSKQGSDVVWLFAAASLAGADAGWSLEHVVGPTTADFLAQLLNINFPGLGSTSLLYRRQEHLMSQSIEVQLRGENGAPITVVETDDIWATTADGRQVRSADGKLVPMTDGNGLIAANLVNGISGVGSGRSKSQDLGSRSWPLVLQVRLYSGPSQLQGSLYKGTLTVCSDPTIVADNTIVLRRSSMRKVVPKGSSNGGVHKQPDTVWQCQEPVPMCITNTSALNSTVFLNIYLSFLLSFGGVPAEAFLEVVEEAMVQVGHICTNASTAAQHADSSQLKQILMGGVSLHEPYVRKHVQRLQDQQLQSLRHGRIPIDDTIRVMGVPDPTGTLLEGEIAVVDKGGRLTASGRECLVYRDPGTHTGDIRKVRVVDSVMPSAIKLRACLRGGHSAVLFSTKGERSLADCLAGGDYDGDEYWICFNPKFVESFRESPPRVSPPEEASMTCSQSMGGTLKSSQPKSCRALLAYLQVKKHNETIRNRAAEDWKRLADRNGPGSHICQNILVETYYKALDAEKNDTILDATRYNTYNYASGSPEWYKQAFPKSWIDRYATHWKSDSILARINRWIDKRKGKLARESVSMCDAQAEAEKAKEDFHVDGIPDELKAKWFVEVGRWKKRWAEAIESGPQNVPSNAKKLWRNEIREDIDSSTRQLMLQGRSASSPEVLMEAAAMYDACLRRNPGASNKPATTMAWHTAFCQLILIRANKLDEQRAAAGSSEFPSAITVDRKVADGMTRKQWGRLMS